ncbi:MAG: FAD-dependent oxidoreductase, partial [Chitinophagaceae bacterium]|nr:FAD-dependent oxidoreductase [Polaromonas sp.]
MTTPPAAALAPGWLAAVPWRVLNVGLAVDFRRDFVDLWQAWLNDPLRPSLLHVAAVCEYLPRGEQAEPLEPLHALCPQNAELNSMLWGLLPGFHRLVFEDGQLQLTLCIGSLSDISGLLKNQCFAADTITFDNRCNNYSHNQSNPLPLFKALARCSRRGTQLVIKHTNPSTLSTIRHALVQSGYQCAAASSEHSPRHQATCTAIYQPAWTPKKAATTDSAGLTGITFLTDLKPSTVPPQPNTCIVLGAGLAGAAVAASLARRGWHVTVLDAANTPAAGASSLPAGLLVAHVSKDDSVLSRLSRSGVRMALQQAGKLLTRGADWDLTGVLEHCAAGSARALPASWAQLNQQQAGADWCRQATPDQLARCGLPAPGAASPAALWHAQAAWVKPASLVKAWLGTPGVTIVLNCPAAQVLPTPGGWQVLGLADEVLGQAHLVVLAAGFASQALAQSVKPSTHRHEHLQVNTAADMAVSAVKTLALQPIRGQVSWGRHADLPHGGL